MNTRRPFSAIMMLIAYRRSVWNWRSAVPISMSLFIRYCNLKAKIGVVRKPLTLTWNIQSFRLRQESTKESKNVLERRHEMRLRKQLEVNIHICLIKNIQVCWVEKAWHVFKKASSVWTSVEGHVSFAWDDSWFFYFSFFSTFRVHLHFSPW